MDGLEIRKESVTTEFSSPYIKVYDLQYAEGKHYYDASRRSRESLMAIKSDEEFKTSVPDAVSCAIIVEVPGEEPRLYLTKEYRYPLGRYLLSVPSGLIDDTDKKQKHPSFSAAAREVFEETGMSIQEETDMMTQVNPLLFCSPGMTDESTAFIKVVLRRNGLPNLKIQDGVGGELFGASTFVTKAEALEILRRGSDENGIYFSAVTWIALVVFVSDIW
ncbi:MAG: NUDIX hydrolase [Eubacteriales bacterium]|nr:NUDIX hydrolase [Eubacteriales bacterium]